MTNLDKIKSYLEQHNYATTREMAAAFGWKPRLASGMISRAHSYWHIEIAGKQMSPVSAKHWEVIWRLRRPMVVRSPA